MEFSLIGILAVVLELFRPILLPLAAIIALDLLLLTRVFARRKSLDVSTGIKRAIGVGALIGIASALYLPAWTGASLSQLQSLIDYAGILAAGLGVAIAVAVITYPPLQLMVRKPASTQ